MTADNTVCQTQLKLNVTICNETWHVKCEEANGAHAPCQTDMRLSLNKTPTLGLLRLSLNKAPTLGLLRLSLNKAPTLGLLRLCLNWLASYGPLAQTAIAVWRADQAPTSRCCGSSLLGQFVHPNPLAQATMQHWAIVQNARTSIGPGAVGALPLRSVCPSTRCPVGTVDRFGSPFSNLNLVP